MYKVFPRGSEQRPALTTSLPEKEEREQAEEDEECWGLGRETGEGEGESELSGDEESRWSSMEASIRRARSFSQLSIPTEYMNRGRTLSSHLN